MYTVQNHRHAEWAAHGLQEFGDFSDCVEFVNQIQYGDDTTAGQWYYIDYERNVIYHGTFGTYNSPGASYHTEADIFGMDDEGQREFERNAIEWESQQEWAPGTGGEESDIEDDEHEEYYMGVEQPEFCPQCGYRKCPTCCLTEFVTDDGYRFRRVEGVWTDGDLSCDSDSYGYPVDAKGERLSGYFMEAGTPLEGER